MIRTSSILTVVIVAGIIQSSVFAQQIPLNDQYLINKFSLSPAYAGFNGNTESFITYRQNWLGIPGAPKKEILNVNMPFKKSGGLGIVIDNQESGNYKYFTASFNYAYHAELSKNASLSFGLAAEMYRNQLDLSNVKAQPFDPLIINNQTLYGTTFDAVFGMMFRLDNLNVGVVVPQLIGMKVNYDKNADNKYTLSRHYLVHASYAYNLNKKLQLEPFVIMRTTMSSPLSYETNIFLKYNEVLWAGVSYRKGNNFGITIGGALDLKLVMSYTYEFSTNGIAGASSGTHEISIGYLIDYGTKPYCASIFRPKPKTEAAILEEKLAKKLEKDFKKYKDDNDKEVKVIKDRLDKIEQNVTDNSVKKYKAPYVLQNITFATNSDKLFSSSFPELDKLAKKLRDNNRIEILITGHTDNEGSPRFNLRLSQKRAEAVKAYLVSQPGIDEKRIKTDGKGDTVPIDTNATREGKAKNRRIEVRESE